METSWLCGGGGETWYLYILRECEIVGQTNFSHDTKSTIAGKKREFFLIMAAADLVDLSGVTEITIPFGE